MKHKNQPSVLRLIDIFQHVMCTLMNTCVWNDVPITYIPFHSVQVNTYIVMGINQYMLHADMILCTRRY